MFKRVAGLALCFLFSIAALGGSQAVADWPNFRGPKHDGISPEKGFRKDWTDPIPLVWERNVGSGFSSFACVKDRIYSCGTVEKEQTVFCLNANTGAVIWEKRFEKEYREDAGGDGTRATPTIDEGKLYILGARGALLCLDAESGKEIWRKQFGFMPQWGYSGSILVEGDLAIASAGEKDGALVAFDKRTGQERWKTGIDPVGYATPYPFTFEGKRYVAGFTGAGLLIVEMGTGREVLQKKWVTDYKVNAASPIFHEGHLFIGSGYSTGCTLLKLRSESDKLAAEAVWENKVLMPKFQSAVLHDKSLYCSDQKRLICVDFLTGKELWSKPRTINGTVLIADGHLLVLTEKGRLQIAKVDPKEFTPMTDLEILSGRCWTLPVLHQGKLYARDLERIVCLDISAKNP